MQQLSGSGQAVSDWRSFSSWRSQPPNWFQLANVRLTTQSKHVGRSTAPMRIAPGLHRVVSTHHRVDPSSIALAGSRIDASGIDHHSTFATASTNGATALLTKRTQGQKMGQNGLRRLSVSLSGLSGSETFQLLNPVLDRNHLRGRLHSVRDAVGLVRQETLAVRCDIPATIQTQVATGSASEQYLWQGEAGSDLGGPPWAGAHPAN